MSMIRIEEVGGKSLERAEKLLAGFPGGVDKAVKSAMSRALSHLRTNSAKEIRKKMLFLPLQFALRKISVHGTPTLREVAFPAMSCSQVTGSRCIDITEHLRYSQLRTRVDGLRFQ